MERSRRPSRGHEPGPGDTIEKRYLVERRIGEGGMGVVFAAKDLANDVRVALKIMNRDRAAEPDSVARFLRETRVVACIDSEHVIEIHDVGTLESGAPYMVTELLVGSDLAHHLQTQEDRRLDVDVAVDYIAQASRGLAAAHAAGIIHRDVKLGNLYLAKSGGDGATVIKVLDFGLCKAAPASSNGAESCLTEVDTMMGTPHYMSPEQYVSARDVAAATDVWALGVCLYRLLTGSVPFDGPNVTNICAKVVRGDFVLPRAIRPDIPEFVEDVIVKCLARNPEDRYRDARELAEALAPALDAARTSTIELRAAQPPSRTALLARPSPVDPLPLALAPTTPAGKTTLPMPHAAPPSPPSGGDGKTTLPMPNAPIPRGAYTTTARTVRPGLAWRELSTQLVAVGLMGFVLFVIAMLAVANTRRTAAALPSVVASAEPEPAPEPDPEPEPPPSLPPPPPPLETATTPPPPPAATAHVEPSSTSAAKARSTPRTRPAARPRASASPSSSDHLYEKY